MLDLYPSSNKVRCDANIAYCNSNTSDTTLVRPYPMMVLKALIEYQEMTYDTAACKMFYSYGGLLLLLHDQAVSDESATERRLLVHCLTWVA